MLQVLWPVLAVMAGPAAVAGGLSLTLYFSNGSLPPPHHFHYRIGIAADGAAELAYTRGDEGAPRTAGYTVSAEVLAALEQQARALAAVRDSFAATDSTPRPIGGATTHARIVLDGEEIVLPTTFNQSHAEALDRFYRDVRETVPEAAWTAVKAATEPDGDHR
jgi:hypothetical protein